MGTTVPLQPIAAVEINLDKLFTDEYEFVIPEYQRPYTWGVEHAVQLLVDLQEALERDLDEPYFLGSIVLVKDAQSPRAEVIDGQQRLVTLTLLLAVLRDIVEDPSLRKDIHERVEKPAVEWEEKPAKPRLTLRRRDIEFFYQYVQKSDATEDVVRLSNNLAVTESQRAIRDNVKALREQLFDWTRNDLANLYKMLRDRTMLVVVSTPDLNSAYRIFNVMNARGLPLLPSDIFKSQVIGEISESSRREYADRWENLEQELGREEFGTLFVYIRAILTQAHATRNLLSEFPEQILSKWQGEAFIDEVLEPYAQADVRLRAQDFHGGPLWESVNNWLKRLSQLNNNDWRPVALWALKEHGDDPKFLNAFFEKLERLAASMLVRRLYRNVRLTRYMALLKQLIAGHGLRSTEFELSEDEKKATREQLDSEIYSSSSTALPKYVLLRLDSILADDPGVSYDHKTISIEHVLPQNPKEGSQWLEWFSDGDRGWWTHRLGNLVLLNKKKNSQARNYDFDHKKKSYFLKNGVSVFALTTGVLQETKWTPNVVMRRHIELIGLLEDTWKLR
ncbi:DUF262 domain-containing protein [Corynebacterium matruchotii]|uniref:DUF262 domain-containing protein n=1 Tax=Corynebacterium matruchotii TaxID=43768 RepID=UPI0028EC3899|nr:DUF262 domain-containing protein [Corynebacterium matruchotii]